MNLKTFFEVSTALSVYKTGETVKELATRVGIQESEVLKLNANENLFLPLDFMQDVLGDVVKDVDPRLYPSEDRNRLQKALGGYLGVSPEQIVLGAGGDQLIELVLHAFLRAGDRMLIVTPTFSMYERTARNMGADCMTVDIEEDFSLNVEKLLSAASPSTDVLVLCNPNNPTSNQFERRKVLRLVEGFNGLVVVDEAYAEYAGYSLVEEVGHFDNLLVLRTFSKAFGLAGLRLGYAVNNREIAVILNERYQMPYSLSSVALKTGLKLLERGDVVSDAVEATKKERDRLIESMHGIRGIRVFPSETNFVLFSLPQASDEVYYELLRRGIIVRRIGPVLGARNYLRVSIAPRDRLERFLDVLKEMLG